MKDIFHNTYPLLFFGEVLSLTYNNKIGFDLAIIYTLSAFFTEISLIGKKFVCIGRDAFK